MIHRRKLDPFTPYQLLPPAFENHRRAKRVLCGWTAGNAALVILLCALVAVTMTQRRHAERGRQQLAATVFPLYHLRNDIRRLEDQNQQRRDWCRWVESARPDDNALQTLAAIAESIHGDTSDVQVDRVQISLPREMTPTESETPHWRPGTVEITARVKSIDQAHRWAMRLNASDRIADASLEETVRLGPSHRSHLALQIEMTATPQATRILP